MMPFRVVARAPRWVEQWWTVAPEIGVYIGAGCVSTAVIAASAGRFRLEASRVAALPDGAVLPSPLESNIRRPDLVVERLKAALPAVRRRETAISLPDAAVRVAILELAHLPARRMEQEALFRHHLEQLFLNPLGRCRFACQRLPAGDAGSRERWLVAAIREEILEEYESVARAAGLQPSVVDLSAFHLFNLYEQRINAIRQSGGPGRRVLFMNLFDRNFTLIMADQSGPTLIRIKAFPGADGDADLITRILAEIDASLQLTDAAAAGEGPPIERFFVFTDRPLDELDGRMRDEYQVETTRLPSEDGAGVSVEGAGRDERQGAPPGAAEGSSTGTDRDDERRAVTMAVAAAVGCRG
ncbi:MAG TPA: pilus assembly protein PilM [Nitrospiria bacterium]|nr:pilus assembly protein PilM [Nitrospiria bacterium]